MHNEQKPEGLSKSFFILILLAFGLFSLYAWTRPVVNNNFTELEPVSLDDNGYSIQSTREFRFAAVGDFDYNKNTETVFDLIAKSNTDFGIGLGDYSYDKTKNEAEWCSLVTDRLGANYPFELVAGNHDVHENGNKQDIDRFASCLPNKMPAYEGIYAQQGFFDYGRMARFINISPGLTINGRKYDYTKDSSDYKWLSDKIDDAKVDGLKWVIVSMHKNCVTVGEKTCEIGTDLMDLLLSKKVDLILQGHEHRYSRSHQLHIGDSCSSISPGNYLKGCVTVSDSGKYKKGEGSILAIVGTGGAELRKVNLESKDKDFFADWSGSNIDPSYGALIIDVSRSSLTARFVGTDNKEHDKFVIE